MKKHQGKKLWELAFDKCAVAAAGRPPKLSGRESDALDITLYKRKLEGSGPWTWIKKSRF